MASGKVHDKSILIASSAIAGAAGMIAIHSYLESKAISGLTYNVTAAAVGCWFGGLALSPDLDLPNSNPTRRWGFLGVLWIPYEMLFKHRSIWSHGLLIGAFIRAVYFVNLLLLLFATADYVISRQWLPTNGLVNWLILSATNNPQLAISLYIGLNIADLIHLILDLTVKNRSFSDGELEGIRRGD